MSIRSSKKEERSKGEGEGFWNTRFWYRHTKALEEIDVKKSAEELVRTGDAKAGDSGYLQMLSSDGQADSKQVAKLRSAELRRRKKANALIEALMKSIHCSRGRVLQARSRKEAG